MRLFSLILCASALFLSPALAQDPPPPPGAVVTQPAPVPTPPPAADSGEKTTARKEDEDETAGMFARIAAFAKSKTGMANNIAGLQKQIGDLSAQVKDLQAKLDERNALLAQFAEWLEINGHTSAQAAAADPGKAFQQAVGTGVANEIRKIGVPAATLKTSSTSAAASTEEDLEAIIAQMKTESDPLKKGRLASSASALREQLAKRSAN